MQQLGALEDVFVAVGREHEIVAGEIVPDEAVLVAPATTNFSAGGVAERRSAALYLLQDHEYMAGMPFPLSSSSRLITSTEPKTVIRETTMQAIREGGWLARVTSEEESVGGGDGDLDEMGVLEVAVPAEVVNHRNLPPHRRSRLRLPSSSTLRVALQVAVSPSSSSFHRHYKLPGVDVTAELDGVTLLERTRERERERRRRTLTVPLES